MSAQSIAVVGVGRMGANMARRLKETGHVVSAVFDVRREVAVELALELGCSAPEALKEVTASDGRIILFIDDY